MSRRDSGRIALVAAALLAVACAKGADERRDTAAAPAAVGGANANPVDTGMRSTTHDSAGMNHGAMARDTSPNDSTRSTAPTPSRP